MRQRIGFFTKPYPHVRDHKTLVDESVRHGLCVVEGFNDSEFSVPDLDAAKRLRDYADEKGVSFSCFSCFCDMNAENAVQTMQNYAKVAEILGAPYLHHTVIPEYNVPERVLPQREQLLRRCVDRVRAVFDFAAERGVRAAYEDQGFILNGIEGFGEFLQRVERPVGVVADLGNILQTQDSPADFIRAFGDRVVHVHIKDYAVLPHEQRPDGIVPSVHLSSVPLGTGAVPFAECFRLLKEQNYAGCYSLEFSNSTSNIQEALQLLDQWLQ